MCENIRKREDSNDYIVEFEKKFSGIKNFIIKKFIVIIFLKKYV